MRHAARVDAFGRQHVEHVAPERIVADAAHPAHLEAEPRQADRDVQVRARDALRELADLREIAGFGGHEHRHGFAVGDDVECWDCACMIGPRSQCCGMQSLRNRFAMLFRRPPATRPCAARVGFERRPDRTEIRCRAAHRAAALRAARRSARRRRRARRRNAARPRPSPPCSARRRRAAPGAAAASSGVSPAHSQLPVSNVMLSTSRAPSRPARRTGRRTHRSCRPRQLPVFDDDLRAGCRNRRQRAIERGGIRRRAALRAAELQLDDARAERGGFVEGEIAARRRRARRRRRKASRASRTRPTGRARESARRVARSASGAASASSREQFAAHFEAVRACAGSRGRPERVTVAADRIRAECARDDHHFCLCNLEFALVHFDNLALGFVSMEPVWNRFHT